MRVTAKPSTHPADYPFRHAVRVRFAETDAMGVVHHGAYALYLEEARVEYLRSIGRPYDSIRETGLDMPVIELFIAYRLPLKFDDVVDVDLGVARRRGASFEMAYCLSVADEVRATAVTVHGCVDQAGRPKRLPDWLGDRPGGISQAGPGVSP